MQKPRPTNATGVTVTLSVVDANGNYRDIGTTTATQTDSTALTGNQTSTANTQSTPSFAGSESYWPSHAVTAFNVDPAAPTATPQPVHEQPVSNNTSFQQSPASLLQSP